MVCKGFLLAGAVVATLVLGSPQAIAAPVDVQETANGTITTYSEEVTPGSHQMIGSVWNEDSGQFLSPSNVRWGGSYALSTEMFQFVYEGRALAAGNVYKGQRITEVCMWYERDGQYLTQTVCSRAINQGRAWVPGSIATVGTRDSVNSNAPKTEFRYYYIGINPNIF